MSLDQTPINQLITDNIDTWTSTVKTKATTGRGSSKKLELYGVKKLRELILELAVRGKLVPQDPSDEPASVLLERIVEIKAQLVKEKKIKPPKKSVEISDGEKPFDIPKNWKWIRLSDYAQIFSGNAFKSGDFSSEAGTKAIKITNAGVGHLIETDEYLPEEFLTTYSQYRVVKNDLILALTRPYISDGLKVSMCPDSYHNSLLNQRVAAIRAYVNPEYAFFMLSSPYVLNTYKNRFSGSGLQPNLKMSDVTELVIPLCSEEEQHRIVAKVDELMTLCDQLEQQTEASIEAHQVLVTTLLDTLTNSVDADELMQNWARISEHFDTLFTTEASIEQLKQTILQLAVMGKLVPQDPADEPAAKLLERIAEEKAQLIKDKKIKKQKALPPIADDEKPFELPNGWEWCRVQDVAQFTTSGSRDWAKYYSDSGALFVTMGNLSRGNYQLRLDNLRYVQPPEGGEGSRTKLEAHDLLISITGDVGNLGLIPEDFGEAYINQHTCLLRFMFECQDKYFPDFMRSPLAKYQFDAPQRGIKNSFRLSDVGEMLLPLPPREERKRVAKKVEDLMIICEQLKACLKDSQTTQIHLTDIIVEQAM
ncbi:restriction endonuclease subunit S [Vibrio crassostreae]|uniref:restriction endonuclease subunit S n=1 Tax=Vibrio crassostreae TaxID=246167 RepID=UPI00070CDFAB|nr:restriction endonuclease subunit S [Vibrio crassostreae]TCT62904.1 type I restriction enzyme S subunit [Vibrio crassostreae]TCT83894.1 type I restriction enzyme S subunit [Vibrio crassostreae]TCU02130.1 type I restriction enzyme S subunit [Vibrio crassostreae]TDW10019.1 type I restriction enzyme S subunit [Vibrio crassostreae]